MLSAFFQLTNRCILKCRYCFYNIGYLDSEKREKSLSSNDVLSVCVDLNIKHAILTGGDPFEPKIINETIETIKKLRCENVLVSVDTSLAISDYQSSLVVESRPDTLFVSCDSHLENIHNFQRGKWNLTLNAMRKILKAGVSCVINCTVTQINYRHIKDMWNFFSDFGIKNIDYNLAYIPVDSRQFKTLSCENLNLREKQNLFNDLLWCAKKNSQAESRIAYKMYQAEIFLGIKQNYFMEKTCQMGKSFFVIDCNGIIKPCFHLNQSMGEIANLNKTKESLVLKDNIEFTCYGKKCSSLFAIDSFWKKGDVYNEKT